MARIKYPVNCVAVLAALLALLLSAGRAASFDLSGISAFEQALVPDSTGKIEGEPRGSMDLLKEMLDRETGEPSADISPWHARKSPRIAMLSALLFPGLGQMYNEKPFKAMIAMGFEIFYLGNILHNYRMEKREIEIRDSYPKYIYIDGEDDEPVAILNYPWREHNAWVEEYRERQVDYIWWSAGCILVIVLDAYVDAHLHDMNFRIESSPMLENPGISLVIDF